MLVLVSPKRKVKGFVLLSNTFPLLFKRPTYFTTTCEPPLQIDSVYGELHVDFFYLVRLVSAAVKTGLERVMRSLVAIMLLIDRHTYLVSHIRRYYSRQTTAV